MDRSIKINKVLTYKTKHDDMFNDPDSWKTVVLIYFNQIYRKEIGMRELIHIMQERGVSSTTFSDTLWQYPIKELLNFIAEISDIVDLEILPHLGQRFFVMDKTIGLRGQIFHIMDTFRSAQMRVRIDELNELVSNNLYTQREIERLRIEIMDRI